MEAKRQLAGKLVPAAPAFPLPSATPAKRVSDRERKAGASSPRRSQCSRYGRIWKPSAAISLAKPRTVSKRDLVRVATNVLALGQDAVGYRDNLATASFRLVNVDELARGRPQDLAVGLGGGLLDRLRHKRNGVDAGIGDAAGKERNDGRRLGVNGLDHLVDLLRRKDGGDVDLDAVGRKLADQLGGGLALGGHARNLDVDVLGPGSDLAGLDLHGLDFIGKDLKRDGHIGDVGQDLLGKRAVIRHAALLHKGRVGRETLNVAVLVHVEHALEVCTVSEHLDCHLPDSFRLHMGVALLNTLPTFIKA